MIQLYNRSHLKVTFMGESGFITAQLHDCVDRLRAGDRSAADELIRRTCQRLDRLTRRMLHDFPSVRRWTETDDVFQNAMLRLLRSLGELRPPTTAAFFALAATQIRRELLDLTRHFYGPNCLGRHHRSDDGNGSAACDDASNEPSRLAQWCEFHRHIADLPDSEREVVDLIYYHGMTQAEAAAILNVNVRTVQRRWQSALIRLYPRLHD
jgi:RNA polymerase sigma-70 factor (ECF subfamily)